MKVLIVGGGGREHALAWKLRRDDPNAELIAAPGTPGIESVARCVPIAADKLASLDGVYGIRVSHNLELMITGLAMGKP